jgi:hypothetical protein
MTLRPDDTTILSVELGLEITGTDIGLAGEVQSLNGQPLNPTIALRELSCAPAPGKRILSFKVNMLRGTATNEFAITGDVTGSSAKLFQGSYMLQGPPVGAEVLLDDPGDTGTGTGSSGF